MFLVHIKIFPVHIKMFPVHIKIFPVHIKMFLVHIKIFPGHFPGHFPVHFPGRFPGQCSGQSVGSLSRPLFGLHYRLAGCALLESSGCTRHHPQARTRAISCQNVPRRAVGVDKPVRDRCAKSEPNHSEKSRWTCGRPPIWRDVRIKMDWCG